MKTYDFIFAGGGLAGLSLACQMARSPLRHRSMLIVDQVSSPRDDRTFSFWSNLPGPFDRAVSSSWKQLAFHAPGFSHTASLGSYRYKTIRGIDFFRQARQELGACSNIEFRRGRITHLQDRPSGAVLTVDGQQIAGKWAFDSRFRPADLVPDTHRYHYLKMSFRGWEIESTRAVFDPQAAILMDFRTPQNSDVRFFYCLPIDDRRALVEYTLFTNQRVKPETCLAALNGYLNTAFKLEPEKDCQISSREAGSLLVTDQPFPRQSGGHVLAIGLPGGCLKPTTGYAFTRIQRDSHAIVQSLLEKGHPFQLPAAPPPYPLLDAIMLEVMACHPGKIPGIFTALFKKNPFERILRFLDEDASLGEIRQLMASLPPAIFLQILARRSASPRAFLRTLISA